MNTVLFPGYSRSVNVEPSTRELRGRVDEYTLPVWSTTSTNWDWSVNEATQQTQGTRTVQGFDRKVC